MRELVCNAVIRSDSESILQQQFGENHGNDRCNSIYFDISTIVWLSRLLQHVSNDDIWACWCILRRKWADINKMDYRLFRRNYLLGCLGKLGEVSGKRVTTLLSLYPHSFSFLSVFQPESCFPWQAVLETISAHFGPCGPKRACLWRTYYTCRIVNWVTVALSWKQT